MPLPHRTIVTADRTAFRALLGIPAYTQ